MKRMRAKLRRNCRTLASIVKPACPNSRAANRTPEMPSLRLRKRIPPIDKPTVAASARMARLAATDRPVPAEVMAANADSRIMSRIVQSTSAQSTQRPRRPLRRARSGAAAVGEPRFNQSVVLHSAWERTPRQRQRNEGAEARGGGGEAGVDASDPAAEV